MAYVYDDVDSSNLTTAVGGSVPAAGSDVVLRQITQELTAGTDFSANDQLSFSMHGDFAGQFKTADLVLVCDQAGAGRVRNFSKSPHVSLRSSSAAGVIAQIEHAPAAGGNLVVGACANTNLVINGGGCTLQSGFAGTNVRLFSGTLNALQGTGFTLGEVFGGSLLLARDLTTLRIYGGSAELLHSTVVPATVETFGGMLKVRESGTISALNGYAGTWDLTGIRRRITVTADVRWPGLTIIKDKNTDNMITFSSTTRPYGFEKVVNV